MRATTMRGLFTKVSSVLIFTFILVLVAGVLALIFFGMRARAEGTNFDALRDVRVDLLASSDGIPAGRSADLAVVFRVPKDYHITSVENGFFFVEFSAGTPPFIKGGQGGDYGMAPISLQFDVPVFPKPNVWHEEEVFQGDVIVKSKLSAALDAQAGQHTITAKVGYQICSETGAFQCFMPVEREVTLDLPILLAGSKTHSINAAIFGSPPTPLNKGGGRSPGGSGPGGARSAGGLDSQTTGSTGLVGSFESAIARGSFMALLIVFVGGILSSFTPCVYPIIPITISYIGARSTSKFGGFLLSIFFVLGLALMYSSLGIIAALTGGVFGGLTQNPVVYGFIIVIFLVMGISMMGAFDLQLPAAWQGKLQSHVGARRASPLLGAIFMGMAAGLIAAPCVGPILVALLTWVAKTGSVLVGFGLLFSFSLGMGMLFIVIGTFAGAITALPKAGQWMEGIKHVFGWLLWGTAVYFARFVLPASWMPLLWGAFLILLGTYVGAFRPFSEHNPEGGLGPWRWIIGKWVGILAIVGGTFFLLFGLSKISGWPSAVAPGATVAATEVRPNWIINDEAGAFSQAAIQGKPLMMDFYADWCVACVELDHRTYNQPEILSRAEKFITLKMDFTKQNEWSQQMTEKYQVKGMPTVIFFTPDGQEAERFVGFKSADEVVQIIDRLLYASRR